MLPSGVWSTLITLSMCSRPSIASWAPGVNWARCKVRAAAFQRMSSTSELLPEPETPVTAVTTPSGNRTSRFLQVMLPRPLDHDRRDARIGARPAGGWSARGSRPCPQRYEPVSDWADDLDLRGRPGRRDPAARLARAGPEVDKVVGRLDDLAVVLDQDQRVAQVAEVPQGAEQPAVVARVQPDRRLVEHVDDAGQPAADLAGQADSLALAAGERRRAAGQASGNRGRRRPGTSGGRGPRAPGRRRCAARPRPAAGP